MATNWKRLYATQSRYSESVVKACPKIDDESGIYFLTRVDENGFRFAYIGQSLHIKQRMISHCMGYQQWIDLSLRKHKFYSENNPYGWKLNFLHYPKDELDKWERYYIKQYAEQGYQLRNVSSGGQGENRSSLNDYKPSKTYRQGVEYGYKKASKEIAHLMDLHLVVTTKQNPPTKLQAKALEKFNDFLNFSKKEEIEDGEKSE